MTYFILGLLLLVLLMVLAYGFSTTKPGKLARGLQLFGGIICLMVAFFLLVRGAAQIAVPLGALGSWLLLARSRNSPSQPIGGNWGGSGNTSKVETEHLAMELDHDSGEIRGRILRGLFEGRRVEDLQPAELALLWQDLRADDPQSAQIIEAFLDSRYPSWREDVERGERDMRGPDGRMTREEAASILGVAENADADTVRSAHRELMMKLHPDRGGSTYLASKINEAKDVLLGEG